MADEITKVISIVGIDGSSSTHRLFARLDEVQLAGLVQLSAQRNDRSIFRVTSGGQSGYLYFDLGLLYSAVFEASAGIEALARMLQLESGTLQYCEQAWPSAGNVVMEPGAALLRAVNFRAESAPPSAAAVSVEPADIRTVDSMAAEDADPARERDPALACVTEAFYVGCRRLGTTLGLGRLDSARLTDERRLFLLFHDARSKRLSAVFGARRGEPAPAVGIGEEAPDTTRPEWLCELCEKPGVMAVFVADAQGQPLVIDHLGRFQPGQAAEASVLATQALGCARELGLDATVAELRFAGRRLMIARSGERCVTVLAVSSVAVQWLRALTRQWARAIDVQFGGVSCGEADAGAALAVRDRSPTPARREP